MNDAVYIYNGLFFAKQLIIWKIHKDKSNLGIYNGEANEQDCSIRSQDTNLADWNECSVL